MGTTIWRAVIAIGFLLGQGVILYTFYETQKTTQKIETIRLMKDLSSDFFVKDGIYRDMRNSIESCDKLYTSWGGKYDHDQINRYLGFFEDVGFYQQNELLNVDIIGHLFGAYIIEAYEYPEIKKYMNFTPQKRQTTRSVQTI